MAKGRKTGRRHKRLEKQADKAIEGSLQTKPPLRRGSSLEFMLDVLHERVKRMVAEQVKEYLELHAKKVLDRYYELATKGARRRVYNPHTKRFYYETEYSTANQRHWIDKILPTLHHNELVGRDGRPLVPVRIYAPDFNLGTPKEPEPEKPPKGEMH